MNHQLVRLGVFTLVGILIIVGFSFYVNDQPFWYRACNNIDITVDDATGLRRKSPVKTLGLDIGYIRSVDLDGTSVVVSVCITAPVTLRNDTKAYVRSIGFLGDRFLELKPVDLQSQGTPRNDGQKIPSGGAPAEEETGEAGGGGGESRRRITAEHTISSILDWLIPSAHAETAYAVEAQAASLISAAEAQTSKPTTTLQASREAELSDTMKKVSKLVDQLTLLVKDVREATSQVEFKQLIVNLNEAAANLAKLLEPRGRFSQGLVKSMDSLQKSLEEFEQAMTKVNKGQGTVGKLINDDKLYEEAVAAVRGINQLIGRAGSLRVFVDLSAHQVPAYDGAKARFFLQIEPNPTRYYLLGVSTDPVGTEERTITEVITSTGRTYEEKIVTREKGLNITAAFGKYFGPLDLRVGLIEGAGALGAGYWLDNEHYYGIMTEAYKQSKRDPIRFRVYARARLFMGLYVKGGVEDVKKHKNKIPYLFGVGLYFSDDDIKYLLAFK